MRKRPKEFFVLAVALGMIGASFPVQVALMYGHPPWEFVPIFAKLAPMNWLIMGLAGVGVAMALRATPGLKYFAPLFLGCVAWNQWIIAKVGLNATPSALIFATAGVVALLGILLMPEARRVLTNPQLRWWQTPPRRQAELRTIVWPVLGGELVSQTFDVSEGGAFIAWQSRLTSSRASVLPRNLRAGSHCSVYLSIDAHRTVRCTAEVVRQTTAHGKYPDGFALRFIGLTRGERKLLKFVVSQSAMDSGSQRTDLAA